MFRRLACPVVLAATAACGRGCGRAEPARTVESFLPADAHTGAIFPSLGSVADKARALLDTLGKSTVGAEIGAAHASLVQQLGFDPLQPADLEKAGVDPKRGLAIFQDGPRAHDSVLVVAARDHVRLGTALGKLAEVRMRATARSEKTVGAAKVVSFASAQDLPPDLAYAAVAGSVAVSAGPGCLERVERAVARAAEQSLAATPRWKRASRTLGPADVLVLFRAPAQLREMKVEDLALGLRFSGKDVALRLYGALAEDARTALGRALPGGGGDLVAHLPAGAAVYARAGYSLRGLLDAATEQPAAAPLRALLERVSARGVDVRAELADLFRPGVALALALQPDADLSRALNVDPARANPFATWRLFAVARVTDGTRAMAALDKLQQAAPALGARVSARTVGGVKAWTATYQHGEGLSWAVVGDLFVATGGAGALEAAIARLSAKEANAPFLAGPGGALLTRGEGAALAIDFAPVAAQVGKMPPEAFGTGPSGMMAQSVALQVVEPLRKVKAALALAPAEGGATLDAHVVLE